MLANTDKTGIKRDLKNNALLATDRESLLKHRREMQLKKTQINTIDELKKELQDLKHMFLEHLKRDHKWQE